MYTMNCYRTSNNKHFTAPPRMDDARHFTDYRPNCHVNNLVRNNNDVFNSFDYRLFLTRNAEQLMDINRKHAYLKNGVSDCKQPYNQGTMLPEKYKVVCDTQNCRRVLNNEDGLGDGRVYSEEPAPCLQTFKAPPLNLEVNKCTPPNENFRYYPDSKIQGEDIQRQSLHSGGKILDGGDPKAYQ